jgi:uncharacterized membrane protein YjjP (DUF1212 family)
MHAVSARFGIRGEFFATPTAIFATFDGGNTHFARVEPNELDLGQVAELDAIVRDIRTRAIDARQGLARIEALLARPHYGTLASTIAFALATSSAARFLGGGVRECAVAAVIGLILGFIANLGDANSPHRRLFVPLASLLSALLASAAAHAFGPYAVPVATLAGVIVLLPGLTLTTGMAELATQHLVAGSARFAGAIATFLQIGFGVAIGDRLARLAFGAAPLVPVIPLPGWTEWLALVVAPIGYAVLLRARRQDLPVILLVGVLAFLGGRLGAQWLGPELGICVGSFIAAALSTVFETWRGRAPIVTLVPAILLLVPGSVGFRSLVSLFGRDVVNGVDTAFRMILMLCGLVAGLLAANVLFRGRRPA